MATYPLGSNRPKKPFEFGLPEPDLAEGSYDQLFQPSNDIQNIRTASVLNQPEQVDVNQMYPQETAASERFKQLLESYPERGTPGFMDKLAGAAAYLGNKQRNIAGGQKAADDAKFAGYNRELEDWDKKIRPAEVAATQENTRNVNSRNLAALELKNQKDERTQTETERKNRVNEDIKQQNADLQALKYANPDLKPDYSGVKVKYFNPRTGETIVTKIDTDKVSDMTKLIMAQGRAETMAASQTARAQLQADTSTANTVAAGAQTSVDAKTGLPVVINPRAATPTQVPVEGGTPIQRVPGTKGPSQGVELTRVRGLTKSALDMIKKDFLVMPKTPGGVPTINPNIKIGTGWGNVGLGRYLPESPERAAIDKQNRLKNLLTLSLIGEMKEQSKTGATGFGQLTGRELDVLEQAASTLDWAQDNATLTEELTRILEKLELIMKPGEGENNVSTSPIAPKYRQSRITGAREVSTDGGKTWKPFVGK